MTMMTRTIFTATTTVLLLVSSCQAWTQPYRPGLFLSDHHADHQSFGEPQRRRRRPDAGVGGGGDDASSSCGCASCQESSFNFFKTPTPCQSHQQQQQPPPPPHLAPPPEMTSAAYVTTPQEASARFILQEQQQQHLNNHRQQQQQQEQSYKHRFGLTCACCGGVLDHVWTELEGQKYHPSCYQQHVQLKCSVCAQGLDGAWFTTDPWGNHVHTMHNTPQCSSCQRFVSDATSAGGTTYDDGRLICGVCKSTAIQASPQIRPATERVVRTLQKQFLRDDGRWIQGQIQIALANRDALTHKACDTAGCAAHSNFHGLTTTTRITTALRTIPQKFTTMEHEITLLSGLPDLQFRGVLAHEFLHVWLNEQGYQPPAAIMEGFCNLGSRAVYLAETADTALAGVLLQQMESDPDPVYGDGYRQMKSIVERQGWPGVVRKLSSYRTRESHS